MASPAVSSSISPEPGRAAPWPCAWHSEAFAAAMLFSPTLDRRSERCLLWRFESSNVVTVPTSGQRKGIRTPERQFGSNAPGIRPAGDHKSRCLKKLCFLRRSVQTRESAISQPDNATCRRAVNFAIHQMDKRIKNSNTAAARDLRQSTC